MPSNNETPDTLFTDAQPVNSDVFSDAVTDTITINGTAVLVRRDRPITFTDE